MCECKSDQKDQVKPAGNRHGNLVAGHLQQYRRLSPNYMGFWWTSCLTVLVTSMIIAWIPTLISPEPPKGNVGGFVIGQFKKVEEVFRLHLLSSEEKGAAFSVYKDSELVVDLWGGYADIQAWQPWKNSTVANVHSLHNVIVSLVMGMLYDRSLIDYDLPVSNYWPEFSLRGKSQVTVRELLSQQAIIGGLDQPISVWNLTDYDYIGSVLSSLDPSMAVSAGPVWFDYDPAILELVADQLVRRVDPQKRSFKTFFEDEIVKHSGVDYYVGLPLHRQYRAARIRGHGFSIIFEMLIAPLELIFTLLSYVKPNTFIEINSITRLNDPEVRLCHIGSIGGFSTARALAQIYRDVVLNNHVSSAHRISGPTWQKMLSVDGRGVQDSFKYTNYTMSSAGQIRYSPKGSVMVGYSASGGQYAFVDKENNISMAYLTNYNSIYSLGLDPRFKSLLRAVYDNI